jgi:hypothetical protein
MVTFVPLTKEDFIARPGTILLTSQGEEVSEETYQANFEIEMWTPFIDMGGKTFNDIYETGTKCISQVLGFEPSTEYSAPDLTAAWYFEVDQLVYQMVYTDTGDIRIECEQAEEKLERMELVYRHIAKKLKGE